MNLKQLLEARKAEIAAAKALRDKAKAEGRDLTDEEFTAFNGHMAKAEELKTQIEAAQKRQAEQESAFANLDQADQWASQVKPTAAKTDPTGGNKPGDGKAKPNIVGGEGSGQWSCFGEWLYKVKSAAMAPGSADKRLFILSPADQAAADQIGTMGPLALASGLGVAVDSDGGYLIPAEFRDALVRQLFEVGDLLARLARASLTGNTLKVPYVNETSRATGSRFGGVRGYWVDEGTAPTASAPKFGRFEVTLKKVAAVGYVTEEMIADYGASSTLMMNAFRDELVWLSEDAVINGTGAGQPLGILNAGALVSIAKESSQTATTVWGANVVKMWARMPAASRRTAVWLANQDVEPQLWSLGLLAQGNSTTSDVIPLYYPAGSMLNAGQYGLLMGRPVLPSEHCKTLGTKGDLLLVDPQQYLFVDKAGGVQAASSIHVRFLQDEQTFRVTYRVDGQPMWNSSITPANGSNAISPFISLDTRS